MGLFWKWKLQYLIISTEINITMVMKFNGIILNISNTVEIHLKENQTGAIFTKT